MRSLARAATSSLIMLGVALALVVAVVAAIGIAGTRAATGQGNQIAGDELTTALVTGQLARSMDAAYTAGLAAAQTSVPAERSRLLGSLYTHLLPAVDAGLFTLGQLHAEDRPAEHADIERFGRQWATFRALLSPVDLPPAPAPAAAAAQASSAQASSAQASSALAAAYAPVSAHLGRLFQRELDDARTDHAGAEAGGVRAIGLIAGAAALGLAFGVVFGVRGIRRIRGSLEPSQDQAEFADTLQIAGDEDEAHGLLQRHLERTLPATSAVVLNRNNSADRLEAVTPLPAGSPLPGTLRGAEPRSCLAVRSGRTHREDGGRRPLLSCPVCAPVPGTSCCVPLTVGGEVIGSVLLTRPEPYSEAEEQRIRESVGQAAPVLANLRNLAVAEIRAATDSLTGLPNKRAVTDALKRMFAQAMTTKAPLSLLLLDLDHFKQVNDQRGHQVGDQVLANVGATLRNVLRARDFAGRNGGEEFAVLLPDTSITETLEIAERVRAAIAEISLAGSDVSVTASVGVAVFPDHASTPDRLERLADAALYLAKRQGRNRVELADPSPAGPAGPAGPPANGTVPVQLTEASHRP
jgi:diguanylate cyclase (GGDEF)-like protein